MPTINWDSTFEQTPSDNEQISYGAGRIRDLKVAIRERVSLEHNFEAGSTPFHKRGQCSVVFYGTKASILALSNPPNGSISYATDENRYYVFDGSAWQHTTISHSDLLNLDVGDPHTQYLKLDKSGQTLTVDLAVSDTKTIDGRDISADGQTLDNLVTMVNSLVKHEWAMFYRTTDFNVSAGGSVIVTWESIDKSSDWISIGDPASRITIPTGVTKVRLSGNAYLNPPSSNDSYSTRFRIIKNGQDFTGMGYFRIHTYNAAQGIGGSLNTSWMNVTSGDYFELELTNGASTSRTARATYNWICIETFK